MNSDNILLISLLNIFLALIVFFFNHKKNQNVVYISLFLILFSIYNITVSLMFFGGHNALFALLLNNFAPLQYLSPVFFYFYIRGNLTGSARLLKSDFVHFLPFAINFAAVIPYIFTPWSHKYYIAQSVMGNIEAYLNYDFMLFYPHEINQYARPVQLLIYFIASLVMMYKSVSIFRKPGLLKLPKFRPLLAATAIMLVFMVFHIIIQLFVISVVSRSGELNKALDEISFILNAVSYLYLVVPVLIIAYPSFLYGIDFSNLRIEIENERLSSVKKKYAQPDKEAREVSENNKMLMERIRAFLKDEKPYLNPDFSVHDICVKLNVPQHQVQYCIHEVMKTKFADLKNELRVKHAIKLLSSESSCNISIEGIGKNSGFASSTNFHTAFKKVTGCTPNEWLKKN